MLVDGNVPMKDDAREKIRIQARLIRFYGFSYADVQAMDDETLLAFEHEMRMMQGHDRAAYERAGWARE